MKPGQHPLDRMDINQPMKLKHFRESDFHEVCGLREVFNTIHSIPDSDEGHGFRKGDKVEYSVFSLGSLRDDDKKRGIVTGIRDAFVRVGSELYHPSRLRKL